MTSKLCFFLFFNENKYLCIVEGSNIFKPGFSAIRFAALPVGAQSLISNFSSFSDFTSALTSVVLPEPGPPVIIDTEDFMELFIASICS